MARVSIKNRERIIVLQFILPALIILCLFVFYPIIKAIVMSFQTWNLISSSTTHPFIGLDNYKAAFQLTHFSAMIKNTLLYTLLSVAGKMILGLLIALLLNRKFHGRSFVRGLILIPWAMPTVVVCNTFLISLDPNYGILSALMTKLPFISDTLLVFSEKNSSFIAVLIISIWKNFPFISLMILAALGGIPKDYYDAASIDGANLFIQFRHITWPQIKPIWNTLLVLQILWTVKEFELIYLITKGGPDNATNVIGIDIYLNAFRFYKVGMACAEGVMLLVFCMIFATIYFKSINKKEQSL
ncbi:sugar ABC transporter permease [uncultured Sphaerochaeta sp.]|uniref:carbohydrate ABC transporter permease n=1 Tax=uncultured Sphaerochaeta sp. TaxID=886478 RepID=UPI002A0A55C8|nr:sugar ABC transporter permease [uncultured Sphaerochaeta sp.]